MTFIKASQYYVATFIAGFSLMTVELISSRIVAPIIGASIFTWTSVIGITLLGLSLGNLLGGELADRYLRAYGRKVLALAMLVSSFLVYLIIPLSKHIDFVLQESSSILVLSVLVCVVLFLLPAIALGALSPIIFKLYVGDIQNIGKKYGLLSSIWSAGSIFGVFITGFYFISTIGSAATVYTISLVLLALFYFFYLNDIERQNPRFARHITFIVCVTAGLLLVALGAYGSAHALVPSKILFQKETAYYDAKVVDYNLFPQFGDNRILLLDLDAHSIRTEKPSALFYTDMSPAFAAFSNSIKNIYVIGAGAYTLPINMRKSYPDAKITVSEIDPEIEKIARSYFNLDAYNIQTEIGDARMKFSAARKTSTGEKYDLIFGDAYNSFISVPWHLLTKESMTDTMASLNPNGIYAINFIGSLEGPNAKMFESVYQTLTNVFPNNYIFAFDSDPTKVQNITIVGVNNDRVLNYGALVQRLDSIDTTNFLSRILVDKRSLNGGSGIVGGMVLTDDYAPIEQMMIGLMDEYFPKYLPMYKNIVS